MKIKELRLAIKMTQVDLAKKMGVSQSTIVAWESGRACPGAQRLPALAAALGVTVSELFREETAHEKGE